MEMNREGENDIVERGDSSPEGEASDRLHSWKEIAAHLRHSIRTVQRWERTEGLPVHRHGHQKRDAVYAYRSEVDTWWRRRGSLPDEERCEEPAGTLPVGPAEVRSVAIIRRPWLIVGTAAAALLLIGSAAAWIYRSARGPALRFSARDYVLVADLENHTGQALFDRSLWTAFTTGLQQSTHANVVPKPRVEAALRRMGKETGAGIDERLGREICLRENVKLLAVPGITGFGNGFGLSVRLIDPQNGETLRAYLEKVGTEDRILTGLEKITRQIRRDLGESLASVRRSDRPLPQVTTPSLRALRAYAEGDHLWNQRQYRAALKSFESALELDRDFAMAHAALAHAYLSHVYFEPAKGREHYDHALRHSGRITERESLFIQASYHGSLNHVSEANALYRRFLAAYPDDLPVRKMFGNLLMRNGQAEEAIAQFREVARATPNDADARIGLASCCRLLGKPEEALAHYEEAFRLEPEWSTTGNINHEYGFGWVQAGDLQKAREVFLSALDKPNMKPRVLRSLAMLNMYQGKYRAASEQLREAIRINQAEGEPLVEARNHLYMAILLDGKGDRVGVIGELDRALQAIAPKGNPPVWLGARIGTLYARAGSTGKAESLLRLLEQQKDRDNPRDRSDLHLLEGALALARRDRSSAIACFHAADNEAPSPLTLSALGEAQWQAGLAQQAIASFEKMISRGHLALGWEPQQAWITAHVHLAEAYLSLGRRTAAQGLIDTLATIWREADQDLPLVRRMARLRANL